MCPPQYTKKNIFFCFVVLFCFVVFFIKHTHTKKSFVHRKQSIILSMCKENKKPRELLKCFPESKCVLIYSLSTGGDMDGFCLFVCLFFLNAHTFPMSCARLIIRRCVLIKWAHKMSKTCVFGKGACNLKSTRTFTIAQVFSSNVRYTNQTRVQF